MGLTRPRLGQFQTTTTAFDDEIIVLNNASTGVNANDIGIVFERGDSTNTALIWDESADTFALVDTTEQGSTQGNVTISSYSALKVGNLVSNNITYPTSDGSNGEVIVTDGSGNLSFTTISESSNTTYDLLIPTGTTTLRLDPSTGTNDDIVLVAGSNVTLTRDSATQLTIATTANNYTHPTSAGNEHLPSTVSQTEAGYLNGVTSAIQTQLNSKTTESYVDTQVTNLIGGAPGALDTLNELAAAINDDSSYASSVTTSLSSKVSTSSAQALSSASNAMTISGSVITLARGDGTTDTVTVPDTNTTYSVGDGGLTQKNFTTTLKNKLDGIETGATADQTATEIQSLVNTRFYNNAVLTNSATTALFIAELIADYGCFNNGQVTLKVQWSYVGSSDLVTGHNTIGTIELAGCTIETWGGTYKHIRITRPNTGTGGHGVYEYNDQGVSYSPAWREIWTSESDGSGSGLDADLLDGMQPTSANTANTIVQRDGSGNFSANVITGTSTTARYADLAENYVSDAYYAVGTVLIFGGGKEVTVSDTKEDKRIAGVVSTDPAYLMNSNCNGEYIAPVALQGRVPCKVSGVVEKGDLIVSSNIKGVGVAWNESRNPTTGSVIGKALVNKNTNEEEVIEVVVGVR